MFESKKSCKANGGCKRIRRSKGGVENWNSVGDWGKAKG